MAINESGVAVGYSYQTQWTTGTADITESAATIWSADQVKSIGTLDGDETSRALGINENDLVVGWSSGTEQRAFVWLDGAMLDLNSLLPKNSGWTLIEAADINDSGMIVGTGLKNGELRAFLLKPPSSAAFTNRILQSTKKNKNDEKDNNGKKNK